MSGFPLLLIPLAVCNIVVFLMPGVSFGATLFTLPLVSGAAWAVTLSDALVGFGLFLLLLEVLKSARPGGKYVTDHLLAFLIFGGAAAEFILLRQFANSTFFLLTVIALVDFLSGLGLRARRVRPVRGTIVADPIGPASVHETPDTRMTAAAPERHVLPDPVAPARVEPIVEAMPPADDPVERPVDRGLNDPPRPA